MDELKKDSEDKEEKPAPPNKIDNIINEVKPVFIVESISGIFRFYLKDGVLIFPNWKMKCYAVLMSVIYILIFSLTIDLPTAFREKSNIVEFIDEVPPMFVLFQSVTAMLATSFLLSKPNIDIGNIFAELDSQLLLSETDYYAKSRKRNIITIIILLISHVITTIVDFQTVSEFTIYRILIYMLYLLQKLEILVFCVTINMLNHRLKHINRYLAKFIDQNDANKTAVFTVFDNDNKESIKDIANFIGSPTKNNMKIRELALMYDTIGVICSSINDVFNFQVFMTLVSTFTYIVVTIWTSLYYYRTPENNSGPLITITIWCLTTVLVVAVMCYVCEQLKLVRNNTKILVNQIIMDYELPKCMRVQAKAFMELIEAWPLRIFVYDMFSVDITLMLKFISVSTTYLIVIIQISHFNNT